MAVELAEVAAGLPMAASLALAGGITTLREGRRRASLNEAMHELRRPLQALMLALPARLPDDTAVSSSLRLAAAALERLDGEVNGTTVDGVFASLPPRPLLEEAVERWRPRASLAGGEIRLLWSAGDVRVEANPIELSQAVDNLISNAIEHGGARAIVEARKSGGWLSISVRDRGSPSRGLRRSRSHRRGGRHGHGLRVVGRVARAHGGGFHLRRRRRGAEATLRLPLTGGEQR
ncbi:MAG TPA: ATP-binding protein [Solirubrobacterales bacterium]|nr:ATP-binding protein [Solirubrobacterales bacterium]